LKRTVFRRFASTLTAGYAPSAHRGSRAEGISGGEYLFTSVPPRLCSEKKVVASRGAGMATAIVLVLVLVLVLGFSLFSGEPKAYV
jgi:hypothetical protein